MIDSMENRAIRRGRLYEQCISILAALVLWTMVASYLAILYPPKPGGDWAYYWDLATNPGMYRRGGLSVFLFSPFKLIGFPPWLAALAINVSIGWLFILALARIGDSRGMLATILAVLYLYTLAPFAGIVQLDMMAALWALVALLIAVSAIQKGSRIRYCLSIACLAMAASTRTQYALVLIVMASLVVPFALGCRRAKRRRLLAVTAALMLGGGAGLALDSTLRAVAGNAEDFRDGVGVVIYTGLLTTADSGPWCGGWTPAALQAAKEDKALDFTDAMRMRLKARPLGEYGNVISCKSGRIFFFEPFALYWLQSSRMEQQGGGASEAAWQRLERWQPAYDRFFSVVRGALWVYLIGFVAFSIARRNLLGAVLPAVWIIAYWCVHSVLEVQGRYFLGMAWLIPGLCLIAYRHLEFRDQSGER